MDQRSSETTPPPASPNARRALIAPDTTAKRLSFLQRTKELLSSQKTKRFLSSAAKSAGKATEAVASTYSRALEAQLDVVLPQIRQYAAQALERIQGKLPTKEQLDKLTQAIGHRLEKTKVFGQPLPDFLAGVLTGAAAKQAARMGLIFSGLGGFPAAAAVGAAGGAASAGAREYLRQRRGLKVQETEQASGIKARLKSEFRMLKTADKQRIGKAMARGAVWGAVGGVVGASIVDLIQGGEGIHEVQEKLRETAKFFQEKAGTTVQVVQEKGGQAIQAIQGKTGSTAEIIKEKGSGALTKVGKFVKPEHTTIPNVGLQEPITITPHGPQPLPDAVADQPQVSPEIAATPQVEVVHLPAGSNPWLEVGEKLRNDLHRDPTYAEILAATKIVSSNSNISVPSWGIRGEFLHTQLGVGQPLIFEEEYHQYVNELIGQKPPGIALPEVSVTAGVSEPVSQATSSAETSPVPKVTPTPSSVPTGPTEAIATPVHTPAPAETLSPQHPSPVRLPTPPASEAAQPPSQVHEAPGSTPAQPPVENITALPQQVEKIKLTPDFLASWPGVPQYLRNYLEQNLGREITEQQLKEAIDIFRAENPIDPSKIPTGIEFKLSGINQYILKVKNG